MKNKNIVEFYKSTPLALNLQTKFSAGFFLYQISKKIKKFNAGTMYQLKIAKKNLMQKFDYVGQFEFLNRDMANIAKIFNLKYIPIYSQSTKTNNRPKVEDLEPKVISELEKLNFLDIELYKFAKENLFKTRQRK